MANPQSPDPDIEDKSNIMRIIAVKNCNARIRVIVQIIRYQNKVVYIIVQLILYQNQVVHIIIHLIWYWNKAIRAIKE